MSRPKKNRTVCLDPNFKCFAPSGKKSNEVVEIFCDELEAMKFINIDWMSMKQWWEKMWVSAPTFNRIVNKAHKKVTDAIINGKTIAIKKCE